MLHRLEFKLSTFVFKELHSSEEIREAYRLRYRICVEQLHWIEGDPTQKIETDEFDPYAFHFGCYDDDKLIGYMRMNREDSPAGIMSRNYFIHLWQKDPQYNPVHTADLSRLIVDQPYVKNMSSLQKIVVGLYRLAYARTRLETPQINYWYFITTKRMLFALKWKMNFPVKQVGSGVTSDGKTTYVAALDLAKGRRRLMLLAPWRLRTFERTKHSLTPLQ